MCLGSPQINIKISRLKRGKGYWKLNVSHIADQGYVTAINNVIDETIFSFSHQKPDEQWEIIKRNVKKASREWLVKRARHNRKEMRHLIDKLEKLKDRINMANVNEQSEISRSERIPHAGSYW